MSTNSRESAVAAARTRLGRAVEHINQRGLQLTRPGRHWLLTSIRLGLTVVAASLLASFLIVISHDALWYKWPQNTQTLNVAEYAFFNIAFAPSIETAMILLMHLLTRRWLGITGFVLVNTTMFATAHIPTQIVPIPATMLFLVMSCQYISFRNDVGRWKAFAGVAVCHAVNNGIGVSFGLVSGLLGL